MILKFLFFIYAPHWSSGGGMVMHELSKILCDLGQDVYLTITDKKLPENPAKVINIQEALQLAQQDDCVTIYPEVESGNRLNAKHVLRWVLYYPGGHGIGDTVYHPSEYVFTYHEKFVADTPHANSPVLRIFQSRIDKFFPMEKERIYDAVLIRKGKFNNNIQELASKHLDPYMNIMNKKIIVLDDILDNVSGFEELNQIFNEIRYFFSFDTVSYHSVLAALSGCTSIVVPIDGISAEQWRENIPTHAYGIAYGFDDLHWAATTQPKTRGYLEKIEEQNIVCTKNMIELVKQKWNL